MHSASPNTQLELAALSLGDFLCPVFLHAGGPGWSSEAGRGLWERDGDTNWETRGKPRNVLGVELRIPGAHRGACCFSGGQELGGPSPCQVGPLGEGEGG